MSKTGKPPKSKGKKSTASPATAVRSAVVLMLSRPGDDSPPRAHGSEERTETADFAGITRLLVSAGMGLVVCPLLAVRAVSEAAADALETGRSESAPLSNATRTCARVYDLSAYRRRAWGPGGVVA